MLDKENLNNTVDDNLSKSNSDSDMNSKSDSDINGNDFSVSNIFEDFEDDLSLENDINKNEKEIKKDVYYYLGVINNIFKSLNILIILVLIILFAYINIEKSDKSYEFLNPVCSVILGDGVKYQDFIGLSGSISGCPSITLADNIYKNSLQKEKDNTYNHLLKVVIDYFTMKDFINSKEVVFLLDKSQNKKNPLSMLEKFDKIKNDFLLNDRLKIQCKDIKLTDNSLHASCVSYSSLWDRSIPGYNGGKAKNNLKGGTSISIASSFLNYLSKQDDLILLNKQKVFTIQNVTGEGPYSYKTPFTVHLEKKELNLK